ncbi:MAG: hypothetical protein JNK12_04900 [Acidimicrobiales bacterium]|nr:hypothetical protein [Acidimicrobiales bacterium]
MSDRLRTPRRALVGGTMVGGAVLVALALAPGALAQDAPTSSTSTTAPTPVVVAPGAQDQLDELDAQLAVLNARLGAVEQETAASTSSVDSLETFLTWAFAPIAVLVGLLAAGGIAGTVNSMRMDNRAGQMHQLAMSGEATAQLRAEQSHVTFLDASQKTLTLVNETLELAKDASARAATSMAERANGKLNDLTSRARKELSQFIISGEFKSLVTEPNTTKETLAIADELRTLEGLFSVQDISLTAPCLFMRGMASHLRQDPGSAISDLNDAVASRDGEQLIDLAYYWIAYEHNNLGQYDQGRNTFARARERATQSGRDRVALDLSAKEHESTFFGLAAAFERDPKPDTIEAVKEIRSALELLIEEARRRGFTAERAQLSNIDGNIRTWVALQAPEPAEQAAAWRQAAAAYQDSVDAKPSWYAELGLLECEWRLSELGEAPCPRPERYAALAERVSDDVDRRYEPRSRVLLHEANFLCRGRAAVITQREDNDDESALRDYLPTHGTVRQALEGVRKEVTLYSAVTKVNLDRLDFLAEVDDLAAEFRDGLP